MGKVGLREHLLLRPLSFMIAPKVSFMEMKSGYIGQCLYARGLKGEGWDLKNETRSLEVNVRVSRAEIKC